ncbi:hypothetical protein U5922_001870 [Aquicoccus sp. G2-2]|uniref:hypothetical protein n=1 Tax=Aquicoccus sp. G2-2 TaxID=3092120 RepID=UPI002ADFCB9F|nr:hypothetical protein [Aquicoccus sp. G2-2]MEA1112275.1 hypothetical protein [Aquicoccus sp. G2-2]
MGYRYIRQLPSFISAVAAALTLAATAHANPTAGNDLFLSVTGGENLLQIKPLTTPQGNRLAVSVAGDHNGGFGQDWASPMFSQGFAAPGILAQTGRDNALALAVEGRGNLFSITQNGTANIVSGQITGVGNMVAVAQTGTANIAHFSQTGTGNSLSISQSSW